MASELTLEFLEKLPKTDLHCHLDGSLRLDTVIDLAREEGFPVAEADIDLYDSYTADEMFSEAVRRALLRDLETLCRVRLIPDCAVVSLVGRKIRTIHSSENRMN